MSNTISEKASCFVVKYNFSDDHTYGFSTKDFKILEFAKLILAFLGHMFDDLFNVNYFPKALDGSVKNVITFDPSSEDDKIKDTLNGQSYFVSYDPKDNMHKKELSLHAEMKLKNVFDKIAAPLVGKPFTITHKGDFDLKDHSERCSTKIKAGGLFSLGLWWEITEFLRENPFEFKFKDNSITISPKEEAFRDKVKETMEKVHKADVREIFNNSGEGFSALGS